MAPETPVFVVAGGDVMSAWLDKGSARVMYTTLVGANVDTLSVKMTYARWLVVRAHVLGDAPDTKITEHFG